MFKKNIIVDLFPKFLTQYQSIFIIQDEEIPSTLVYVLNYLHHSLTRFVFTS